MAAAANLTGGRDEVGEAVTRESRVPVTFSYGATALLAHQVSNGAPFDVFAAADTQHPEQLFRERLLERPAIYARGRLALWAPRHAGVKALADLTRPEIRFVAIARPAAAPYGAAAVEALRRAGLWEQVQPKVVYAANINIAREYVKAGSADSALTAWSLVLREANVVLVDSGLHAPLDQAIAVVLQSPRIAHARRFAGFVLGPAAQQMFSGAGYETRSR